MLNVLVCVGSSCHIKGSEAIVQLFQEAIAANHLENRINLAGSFCIGKCNRIGVTVQVEDEVYTGITREGFQTFFTENVLNRL